MMNRRKLMAHPYAWTRRLPDAAIAEILDGLHDMLAGSLRKALRDEIWQRYSYPLQAWLRVDNADAAYVCAQLWRRLRAEDEPEPNNSFYREAMRHRDRDVPGRPRLVLGHGVDRRSGHPARRHP